LQPTGDRISRSAAFFTSQLLEDCGMAVPRFPLRAPLGLILTAVVCLAALGCALPSDVSSQEEASIETTATAPEGVGVESTATGYDLVDRPSFKTTDYSLPEGCFVSDFTERLAVYSQNTFEAYPVEVFGLLDLDSGCSALVLTEPVNVDKSYDAFTPLLSDEWIAWHEVSSNESAEPENARWCLYAARVDAETLSIAEPILIDSGNTSTILRPFYGLRGNELVWSRNLAAWTGQEMPASGARLMSVDLSCGGEREIASSSRNWRAVRISGDVAVLTELTDVEEWQEAIVVVDLDTGEELDRVDMPCEGGSSHFAERIGRHLVWAAFASRDAIWPRLYASDGVSQPEIVRGQSMDVCGVGPYAVFESLVNERGSTPHTSSRLMGCDPESHTCWVLDEADEGYWELPMASGWSEALVVAVNDVGPYVSDASDTQTLVRCWRLESD